MAGIDAHELYGGQAQPLAVFAAAVCLDRLWWHASASDSPQQPALGACQATLIAWGVFLRLVALAFAVSFASLRGQIIGLSGSRGLYPAFQTLEVGRAAPCAP